MTEYIIDWPHGDSFERCFGHPPEKLMGFAIKQPIVRCRNCKYAQPSFTVYGFDGTAEIEFFDCMLFEDTVVEHDGFCKWGERE